MVFGHLAAWFAYNGQYAWESWKQKSAADRYNIGTTHYYYVLVGIFLWLCSYDEFGMVSSVCRALPHLILFFPLMTYVILSESFMTS